MRRHAASRNSTRRTNLGIGLRCCTPTPTAMHFISARSARLQWRLSAGFFTGAVAIYFDRWFNMPAARLPQHRRETDTLPTDADTLLEEFVELLDTQAQVDKAGMYIYRYLSLGHPSRSIVREARSYPSTRRCGVPLFPDAGGSLSTGRGIG